MFIFAKGKTHIGDISQTLTSLGMESTPEDINKVISSLVENKETAK